MADPYNPLADREKDGLTEIQKLAIRMCMLVQRYKPIILAKYGSNLVITGLIVAIEVVCGLLPDFQQEMQAIKLDSTLPPLDPSETAGINPAAPIDYPPDYEPVP